MIMGTSHRSGVFKRSNDSFRLILMTIMGIVLGYFIGVSFPSVSLSKMNLPSSLMSSLDGAFNDHRSSASRSFPENLGSGSTPLTPKELVPPENSLGIFVESVKYSSILLSILACSMLVQIRELSRVICKYNLSWILGFQIYVPTNPRGAESLPPGIVVSQSDLYLRRLWGDPSEDLKRKPKYLVTFTVGLNQKNHIDASVKKFSADFQIMLFHYDGRTTEWDQFEWSQRAIHVSVRKQTKWWYAKRFLHPDIVAAYDYIFIWDEDLSVEHFNAEKYIQLVKKHGLEISQPGLEPNNGLTWQMTKRRGDREVHKDTEEKPGWCSDPHLPPCAAELLVGKDMAWKMSPKFCFVEIMAPVFSREAWRCVWHMIQNDLVHGWGLDFALRRCVDVSLSLSLSLSCPAHEKIGVVDSQWIVHQVIPSLGSQGESENGKAPWQGVRERCRKEWALFQDRLANADKAYFAVV
ncbi:hypothetical protein BUALT_Bualt13G0074800 [Buddleja alternifolia]|uniref:Storage protein n=1 Tax=Buddleja alternifolia TaxID=168488 RepID=A0AAV6WU10_9LAMI|nr:hypothetical protein BUALT_Bualt13G0074800 [Buddleja alternifolia]